MSQEVVNVKTGKTIVGSAPTEKEVFFDGGVMITETNRAGIITFASKKFRELTGYTKEELIGAPHSINRHPDMPKGAFRALWKTISNKKIWRGYIKNITKDGSFYWVLVYIQPKLNKEGKIIGFVAGRKIAYPEQIKEVEKVYKKYNEDRDIDNPVFSNNSSYHQFLIEIANK